MKPIDEKKEYINLRAQGKSYQYICDALHISKSTCSAWEKELKDQIDDLKKAQLAELAETYGMAKEARIKRLGDTLNKINAALQNIPFDSIEPSKLLDFKLKYTQALKEEYTGTTGTFKLSDGVDAKQIITGLADLLNRIQAGEVTAEQAAKESTVFANLLKAYENAELKTKLEALEDIIGGRK